MISLSGILASSSSASFQSNHQGLLHPDSIQRSLSNDLQRTGHHQKIEPTHQTPPISTTPVIHPEILVETSQSTPPIHLNLNIGPIDLNDETHHIDTLHSLPPSSRSRAAILNTLTRFSENSTRALRSYNAKSIIFMVFTVLLIFETSNFISLLLPPTGHDSLSGFHSETSSMPDVYNFPTDHEIPASRSHVDSSPSLKIQPKIEEKTLTLHVHLNDSHPPHQEHRPGKLKQRIGKLSAWLCASLYLTSRIPQIVKNYRRKSVEGLSILLFILAFFGNLTYVLSILTSTFSSSDVPIITSKGVFQAQIDHTVEHHVSARVQKDTFEKVFLNESIPYLIGSAGTLCFDLTIFIQSRIYRNSSCSTLMGSIDNPTGYHLVPSSPKPSCLLHLPSPSRSTIEDEGHLSESFQDFSSSSIAPSSFPQPPHTS